MTKRPPFDPAFVWTLMWTFTQHDGVDAPFRKVELTHEQLKQLITVYDHRVGSCKSALLKGCSDYIFSMNCLICPHVLSRWVQLLFNSGAIPTLYRHKVWGESSERVHYVVASTEKKAETKMRDLLRWHH